MNVSATIIAFYLPVFIMVVLYFQVSKLKSKWDGPASCRKQTVLSCTVISIKVDEHEKQFTVTVFTFIAFIFN